MKTSVIIFVSILLFTSCTHRIVRTGYPKSKSDYTDCDIAIKRFMKETDSIQKIGEIKLGESGFSVACSEAHAIKILKNEACALQADVINIVEENRPDLWSSCYRCRAEFYKYNDSLVPVRNDEIYQPEKVEKRVSQDRGRNAAFAILAVVAGIVISSLLF